MNDTLTAYFESPLGTIEICATQTHITSVNFREHTDKASATLPKVIQQCIIELQEYFDGKRREFSVKVQPEGTLFQQKVWDELQKIKYGETTTYGKIANTLNDANASRAVGLANGKNPVAIIIPCHRVIGESGKLTGYAGGMWRKSKLLELEGNVTGRNRTLF